MKQIRHLHLVGATGTIRTAKFDGRDHMVVPVVAMVEGVVWAVNSQYPEFVSAEELARTPQQWDGRPAFAGHPEVNGTKVTANSPRVLEKSFGVIFNTVSEERILTTRRLEFEVYLDPIRAAAVGPKAEDVVVRLSEGKTVEVSIGAWIISDEIDGVWNGKPYVGAWTDIVSDHIAFLEEDETGACSVSAGCGAPRAAVRHLITAEGIQREEPMAERRAPSPAPTGAAAVRPDPPPAPPAKRSLRERFLGLLSSQFRADEGTSDIDLRRKLDAALHAVEPGYMGIDAVFPDDKLVIYSVMPADEWKTLRRSFTLDTKGDVTIAAKAEEVEPVTTYEPVTAAAAALPCSCGRQARTSQQPPTQGRSAMTDRVKKFIEESGGKFTETDAVWLESIPEDRLVALKPAQPAAAPAAAQPAAAAAPAAATTQPAATAAAAPVAQPAAAAATRVPTEDEWLAAAPPTLRELVTRQKAADAARRTELVGQLKTAQSEYTEAELNALPMVDLERVGRLAKVETVDYSGMGGPRVASNTDVYANPPRGWDLALAERNKAATQTS